MTQKRDTTTTQQEQPSQIFHPRFAAFYERYARLGSERRLRREIERRLKPVEGGANKES